jgi:putative CocE/NonD family hydrolase
MGANTWVEEDDWPPPGSRPEVWFLHSQGQANTAAGDGVLSQEPCSGDEPADGYVYDPRDPVPTVGGATFLPGLLVSHNAGAKEQSSVERRPDVLVYTSLPLDSELDVAGQVEVTLSIASSASGTDFTAKLVDVGPDGKAYVVCDGILSLRPPVDTGVGGSALPGEVEKITIRLGPTAMRFGRGHRLRLDVSSSNFPRFARNPNSGVPSTEARASDFRTARQRVFHDALRVSFLELLVRR